MINFLENIDNIKYQIYCFTNKVNGKKYIGKTGNFHNRMNAHKIASGDCPHFHNAIKKYGIDSFDLIIIDEYKTEEDALVAEIFYISHYKSNNRKYGYNLTNGGDGISGHFHSEESKLKISIALKGREAPNKGKFASDETKLKLSKSHIGQPGYWTNKQLSEEHKQKLSESHIGIQAGENHPMFGKHHANESRQNISAARKGKNMGENNPKTKLTTDIAEEIRSLYLSKNYTYDQLAEKFVLGRTTIFRVIKDPNYFSKRVNNG